MRASEESSTGGVGVAEVCGLFERIRWAPLENKDRHDLGTDLLVAVRDPRRFDRGLLVGVQVKGGPSWFTEPKLDANGQLLGWWHRDSSEHFDHWVKHQLPHLVVLYDIDARVGYWVHVTADQCESTGKGVKILVSKKNTISEQDVPKLLKIAIGQRGSISLEGTSFDAAAVHVAPGDRLRFALLIPRLIAPHANQSKRNPLEPEEAVALLTLLHVQRLRELLEKDNVWPNLNEPPQGTDWRWQFAYAFWRYIAFNDKTSLEKAYADVSKGSQSRTDWRVAVAIVLASAEFLEGRTLKASLLIDGELARDRAAPIDNAWLRLHAAHYAAELGNGEVAKEHASKALPDLAVDTDNPTASLLSGVGYRIILHLTSWQNQTDDISATLKAGDNAGSWWRDQQLRWALDAVALENFRAWSHDATSRWEAEPPQQQLRPSALMALFTADHEGWAAAESRLGRYEIQSAEKMDEYQSAFFRLLRSGDKASVVLAGNRLRNYGPASVLSYAAANCVPSFMVPARTDTMLAFWSAFGDTGAEQAANEVIAWCLEQAAAVPSSSAPPTSDLLETILATLPASSETIRHQVASSLSDIPLRWTDLAHFSRLIHVLNEHVQGALDAEYLLSIARRHPDQPETAKLWDVAARAGSVEAKANLLCAARAGNFLAIALALNSEFLTDEIAKASAEIVASSLDRERSDASRGTIGFGRSVDHCLLLVALSLHFPSFAQWQSVIGYLGDAKVIADHKVAACCRIVREVGKLAPEILGGVLEQIPGLRESKYLPKNVLNFSQARVPAIDLADYVAWNLSAMTTTNLEDYVSSAFASGGRHKRWAWEALSSLTPDGYDLLALQSLSDDDLGVRVRCAQFLALRVEKRADSPTLRLAAKRILLDGSVILPDVFLSELSTDGPAWIRDLVKPLSRHSVASIRMLARKIVDA